MLIVDSQIHLWENGKMSAHHRQIPTYSMDDALAEMAAAGVDAAVIHPPSTLGEAVNALAVEAARLHPDKFCILGHFDLQSPDRENIVAHWRRAAGHARVPLHLQPAASEGVVDRRLARLVLGGVREGGTAHRPAGRRAHGRPRQDRRAPSRAEAAHRPPWPRRAAAAAGPTTRPLPICREMLALAKYPNVAVKLSGAPSYSSQPYPYRNIHGYLRQIFEAFGPAALLLGHRHHPHAVLVSAMRDDVHRGAAVARRAATTSG